MLLMFDADTEDEPVYQPQSLCLSEMDLPIRDDLETDVESESNCTGEIICGPGLSFLGIYPDFSIFFTEISLLQTFLEIREVATKERKK